MTSPTLNEMQRTFRMATASAQNFAGAADRATLDSIDALLAEVWCFRVAMTEDGVVAAEAAPAVARLVNHILGLEVAVLPVGEVFELPDDQGAAGLN